MRRVIQSLARSNRGAAAIEYALIGALIVIALVGGLVMLGGGLDGLWGNVSTAVAAN